MNGIVEVDKTQSVHLCTTAFYESGVGSKLKKNVQTYYTLKKKSLGWV